jgi:hypothetical protein
MKFTLLFILLINCTALSAQKTHKKVNNDNLFPYSYKCTPRNYKPQTCGYNVRVSEWNSDSLIITGYSTHTFSGIISYKYNSKVDSLTTNNGNFELVFPKSKTEDLILFTFRFNEYKEKQLYVLFKNDWESFLFGLDKKLIFEDGNRYIIVHSKTTLDWTQLRDLINCLPSKRGTENNCFDPESIQISYPD